ncbi:MAG: DUF3786 domain-containing protein [Actinobacteria bacterium]|nr:DUF3786 domain-containing protein [Actinomycetota bacterium]MBU4386270.1 DUF3786 domain-containing protein [Actinomycetota bacterium]MBU4489995.1 DUF3786 domain-containing protein [Actinomycetota bacterium]MCG2794970.1 DUF3786 domain-containing protein [Actinomycetes bacterium]
MVKLKGASPFDEPVGKLRESDPEEVAGRTGAKWLPVGEGAGEGDLVVPVLEGEIVVNFPAVSLEATPGLDSFTLKLLTLLYLCNSDGMPPSGSWVAYREVPGGRFYEPVVARSIEDPLARAFGSNPGEFVRAAETVGGSIERFGDAACSFALFPLVPVCFIIWRSDEEFGARAQVLFDSNCDRHLDAFNLRMGAQEISSRLISGHQVGSVP